MHKRHVKSNGLLQCMKWLWMDDVTLLIISNIAKILACSLFLLNQAVIKTSVKTTQQVKKNNYLIVIVLTFLS